MKWLKNFPRKVFGVAVALGCVTLVLAAPPTGDKSGLLPLLGRSVDWYRQIDSLQDKPGSTREIVVRQFAREHALHALTLEFQFARAQAPVIDAGAKHVASPTTAAVRLQQTTTELATAQAALAQVNAQLPASSGANRAALVATRDKLTAEINLATAERDTLTGYTHFISTAEGGQSASLADKVNGIEQSFPELNEKLTSGGEPTFDEDSAGVFSQITQLFSLGTRLTQITALINQSQQLSDMADQLRQPLRASILDAVHRGDVISTTRPTATPEQIEAESKQLNDLATKFQTLAAASVPLAEAKAMLDTTHQDLIDWHTAVSAAYTQIGEALLWKLGGMVGTIILVFILSEFWRRATFRYVNDIRRRRQLMLVRRIVVGIFVLIIIIATVATEISQLATFAGLITAGIAVALQTVILSGVAYFFFIGRFGVRVGDRVTISGVTGDVVEIGLFRLYLMELKGEDGDLHSTGRIVVFSNSVLFQSSAFFKQLPGADYVWHEQVFSIGANVDYKLAEQRLLAAVNEVYATYKDSIERQHAAATSTSLHVTMETPHPEGRVRFVGDHLEFVLRYPVEIHRASEIDDQVTRKLLLVMAGEPGLKELKPAG
jgi:small-conductance mechanosensitive channel